MVIKNSLDKSFGPAASFAGYIFIVTGTIAVIWVQNWIGIPVMLLGMFVSFTGTVIKIDTETRKFKFYTRLLGIIPIGKWYDLNMFEGLGMLKDNRIYTAHSRSNRTISTQKNEYGIYLLTSDRKIKIPVKKCKKRKLASKALQELSKKLHMSVIK